VQLGILLAVGVSLRVWVLAATQRLSADEAIPGLMARHVLAGEWPVFYWGQQYFGALESYLIAACFAAFGFHPWLLFAPALVASAALIPLTWVLGEYLGPPPAGLIAALPIAIAPPILARVLENAGGGFALGFGLQLAAVLLAIRALREPRGRLPTVALMSLIAGAAAWVWQPALLSLPPLLIILIVGIPELRSLRGTACLTPALIGLWPMLAHNAATDWPILSTLLLKFQQQAAPGAELTTQVGQAGRDVYLALAGTEEPFGGSNKIQAALLVGGLLLGPIVLLRRAIRSACCLYRQRALAAAAVLLWAAVGLLAAHGGTRYVVPVILAACGLSGAVLAMLIQRAPRLRLPVVGACLLLCAMPNLVSYLWLTELMAPEQLSQLDQTESAVEALDQRGLTTGYADYWAAYPTTYISAERIIAAPSLPPLYSRRVDRYPEYTAVVNAVDDPARLFLLVDARCSSGPYLAALESAGAAYRADPVARWLLIWDIQPRPGAAVATLAELREAIDAEHTCRTADG
jgi:hypothetical protein